MIYSSKRFSKKPTGFEVIMTEKELKKFSEIIEERKFGFLGGLTKTIMNPKTTWNSGALGKAKVIGTAALSTGAVLGTTGAMVGNHLVNNDNNDGL